MKTIIALLFFVFVSNFSLHACDMCGCFMGITPYDNQSSFSFLYRYRSFNGYRLYQQPEQTHRFFPAGITQVNAINNQSIAINEPLTSINKSYAKTEHGGGNTTTSKLPEYSNKDYEKYQVYELRGKYFIHPRVELNSIVPLINNKSFTNGLKETHLGIGDITFFAAYHVIKRIDVPKMQQRLITGGGIKLPIGNYYAKDNNGFRLPFLMQSGTGSIDYFGYANYIVGYKKLGLSINTVYKLNGTNYYREKIENSTTNYANVFYKIKINKWILIPSVQFYYEYTKGLKINNELVTGTNMNVAMLGGGLDAFYKSISVSTAFQFPVYERVSDGNLGSAGKMILGLHYNFNQTKYLFKRKNNSNPTN